MPRKRFEPAVCYGCDDPECPDVLKCLHCKEPLHWEEPLTFIDNAHPWRGGCHIQCVDAYHQTAYRIRPRKTERR